VTIGVDTVSGAFVATSSEFELHVTNPGEYVVSGISSSMLFVSWPLIGGICVEVVSFLKVSKDIELEMLVVTSTIVDAFMGTFVRVGFVGFVMIGFGLVTPIVDLTVDDNGRVLSVVVVLLLVMYSGLVVFIVVLAILVGFDLLVVVDNGLGVVVLLPVVVFVVVDRAVVVLMVDVLVVVLVVGLGVVVFLVDTF